MSQLTRRQAVGAVTGAAAAVALTGVATAWADSAPAKGKHEGAAPGGRGKDESFDEVFQGRRIQGEPMGGAGGHAFGHGEHRAHRGHGDVYRVLIDGRELQVMRHGKSGWSSAINHYERFATPLDAARTAVTSLKGASVVPFDPNV
ncbi:apotyrosinase chaperone MelC1 [Streptomyces albipurpureus]|uniref:Tyrosinase cofactor n=1 Tax=Streptomyces albipurpureus TaxID=2897419 RepID=A0ABT0UZL5_9ACTN|nr:tyrosinase cofactor [Streptomyces sp. CWNU-1]MCM2393711.1 tyrosinase cofactor [Streptomyces sp. CWNU-1]